MNDYLQRALTCMETAAAGLDAEALSFHPAGKWSSAEIMDHLSSAFSSTSKLLTRHLESQRPARNTATWGEHFRVLLVIELGLFPNGRKAPEFTLPQGIPAEQALAHFRSSLEQMDEAITRCEREFGARAKIARHAIFGPLTARQWRRFHWVHTRHHARQVQNLNARGTQRNKGS